MRNHHPDTEWPDFDPPLAVATTEEIAIADALRRALERRYLGPASPYADGAMTSDTLEWDEPID
jgi:hypothetical protein